jgi:hypothetical protein
LAGSRVDPPGLAGSRVDPPGRSGFQNYGFKGVFSEKQKSINNFSKELKFSINYIYILFYIENICDL